MTKQKFISSKELSTLRAISGYSLRKSSRLSSRKIPASTLHAYEKGTRSISYDAAVDIYEAFSAIYDSYKKDLILNYGKTNESKTYIKSFIKKQDNTIKFCKIMMCLHDRLEKYVCELRQEVKALEREI